MEWTQGRIRNRALLTTSCRFFGFVAIGRCWQAERRRLTRKVMRNEAVRKVLKRMHYRLEVMRVCVRWYAA